MQCRIIYYVHRVCWYNCFVFDKTWHIYQIWYIYNIKHQYIFICDQKKTYLTINYSFVIVLFCYYYFWYDTKFQNILPTSIFSVLFFTSYKENLNILDHIHFQMLNVYLINNSNILKLYFTIMCTITTNDKNIITYNAILTNSLTTRRHTLLNITPEIFHKYTKSQDFFSWCIISID